MPSSLQLFDDDPDQPTAAEALLRRARPVDASQEYDDLRTADGKLRPGWQAFAEQLGGPLDELTQRQALLARQIQEDGVTYNIYSAQGGASRPWSLEVLPRLIEPQDWRLIEQGAAQRASLLNQIAADVYGEQQLLKDAYLPAALVLGHPGYLRGLHGVKPLGGVYLHVVAFDMVRGPDGAWWVVSQRTEAPSGLGYVMQNRLIVSRLFPDAFRAMSVQHLASGFRRLLDTLQTLAEPCANGQSPRLALLTPGPYNETYFEHAYLARYLGLPLVEGGDLTVRDERLYLKTVQGLEPIHGLLRRLDDDYCDPLELRSDSTLGVPGLMQAVRAGNVVMANALGTGFLESPAVHGFLPALSRHLLGKELMLPSLPTWWCGEEAAWQDIKPDLGEQVIRPSYPFDKQPFDAVVGPTLSPTALKAWSARIERDRAAYTLQNFVPYAQLPVWSQGQCSMRGASLRVYALADGKGGWQVLPGGMTRIATRDSGPVSMQLGGSSLDTWVITDGPVDTFSMLHQSLRLEDLVQRQRPVASRTGESLFWMGRYTERTEFQLRLVQGLSSVLADDDETDPSVLEALSDLARLNGLVPTGTPSLTKSPRVFERAAVEALGDAKAEQGAHSLAYNLGALERSAQSLRERLSPEHWRLLRALGDNFHHRLTGSQGGAAALADALIDPEGDADPEKDVDSALSGLAHVHDALDHLAMQLAAVTGAQSDRMTRDAGWRLLTVGRLVERLVSYSGILQAFWLRSATHTPQGFDLMLMLFDSAITFRARFQRRLEVPALLAMLVVDETNPRSLACVLRRLRTELGKLPDRAGPKEDMLALLPQEGVGVTLEELCEPELGNAAVLTLAQRLMDAGWLLSDELGRRYFAHSEPTEQMVSA
jgi:uncharacterized circularly permuted ATP-grasp superfamily protein/uncharacterized alpha-E superfamily protein